MNVYTQFNGSLPNIRVRHFTKNQKVSFTVALEGIQEPQQTVCLILWGA